MNGVELTNLSLEEKNVIYDVLVDHGLPINSEGKDDFAFIKTEMQKVIKPQKVAPNSTVVTEQRKKSLDTTPLAGKESEGR